MKTKIIGVLLMCMTCSIHSFARELNENWTLEQKATAQLGYGPSDSIIGQPMDSFYGLRYVPTLIWRSPDPNWPTWEAVLRGWINYSSSATSTAIIEDNRDTVEGTSAELSEFYIQRNLLWNDPRFSISLGRRKFSELYGYWWDDSLESIKFSAMDGDRASFIAIGRAFYRYNTEENELPEQNNDSTYIMSSYSRNLNFNNLVGMRFLMEDTGSDEPGYLDYEGYRLGVFTQGQNLNLGWLEDYYFEIIGLDGELSRNDGAGSSTDRSGWAVIAELGWQLTESSQPTRFAIRSVVTDKPDGPNDGFFQNSLQSDRVKRAEVYSTGLAGSFLELNVTNVAVLGFMLETQPCARCWMDFRIFNVDRRSNDGTIPLDIAPSLYSTDDKNLGQIFDFNYYWKMYPRVLAGSRADFNILFGAGYFIPGKALDSTSEKYQVSVGLEFRF